jgi:hypothetical protein
MPRRRPHPRTIRESPPRRQQSGAPHRDRVVSTHELGMAFGFVREKKFALFKINTNNGAGQPAALHIHPHPWEKTDA